MGAHPDPAGVEVVGYDDRYAEHEIHCDVTVPSTGGMRSTHVQVGAIGSVVPSDRDVSSRAGSRPCSAAATGR